MYHKLVMSQCPLEHCMLSDFKATSQIEEIAAYGLNALSSIVCFLTPSWLHDCGPRAHWVSMPSRALYAF